MKRSICAVGAAFIIGVAGAASAASAPSHRHHRASASHALSLNAYRDVTAAPTGAFQSDESQTATGGPSGGTN